MAVHDESEPRKDVRPPTASAADTLRRRLRQLESNHKSWQDQVQKDLRRQKMELETLRRDNDQFKQQLNELRLNELASGTKGGSLLNPNSTRTRKSRELDAKRDTYAHLESKIQSEQLRLDELEEELEGTREAVREARKHMGGVNITQDSHDMIDRQVTVLENRLDQSLVRFNEVLRQNKELREQIDTLRGERDVFEGIYQKLEAELQEKKKEMAFIIEVSNIAYEERDNNAQVLVNLKAFAQEEMSSFAETFKELDELLEEDRRMKEQVKARIVALEKKLTSSKGERGEDKKKAAKGSVQAAANSIAENPQSREPSQLHAYEEAFQRIRQATDIPDLDEVVQRFLRAEEENYSLFSYVNDLGKEIESLEQQRAQLLDEIEHISLGNEEDQKRRSKLKVLEDRLRNEEHKNQRFIDLAQKADSTLRGVMATVESIFTRLDCDDSVIVEQHGVSGLTLENLLLYLAAIEMRTDEYVASWGSQTGSLSEIAHSRGPQAPADSSQVTVDTKRLPGTGEDAGEGSDDDDHPLSREELLRKVQKKLSSQALANNDRRAVRAGKNRGNVIAGKK
jgi:chromosome segregation ATPase